MNLQEKLEQSRNFQNDLINRCWEDEEFKNELVANPIQVLAKLGASIDEDRVTVKVNDQTDPTVVNINIPPKPDFSNVDVELTAEDLETVAGGVAPGDWSFSSFFGSCVTVNTTIIVKR